VLQAPEQRFPLQSMEKTKVTELVLLKPMDNPALERVNIP